VDAVVASTDKNFMVPVGGAVVTSGKGNTAVVDAVRRGYPGRASISPILDLLITLLSMGVEVGGWSRMGLFACSDSVPPGEVA
jgi:O-phospho-L-seryl-tRNASec:L-selenocysteinyl-tRNA synthase